MRVLIAAGGTAGHINPALAIAGALKKAEEKLYNWDNTVGSNAIEVHIHHLRKKLSDNAIKTVRGVGYLLET